MPQYLHIIKKTKMSTYYNFFENNLVNVLVVNDISIVSDRKYMSLKERIENTLPRICRKAGKNVRFNFYNELYLKMKNEQIVDPNAMEDEKIPYKIIDDSDVIILLIEDELLGSELLNKIISKYNKIFLPIIFKHCLWKHNDFVKKMINVEQFPLKSLQLNKLEERMTHILEAILERIDFCFWNILKNKYEKNNDTKIQKMLDIQLIIEIVDRLRFIKNRGEQEYFVIRIQNDQNELKKEIARQEDIRYFNELEISIYKNIESDNMETIENYLSEMQQIINRMIERKDDVNKYIIIKSNCNTEVVEYKKQKANYTAKKSIIKKNIELKNYDIALEQCNSLLGETNDEYRKIINGVLYYISRTETQIGIKNIMEHSVYFIEQKRYWNLLKALVFMYSKQNLGWETQQNKQNVTHLFIKLFSLMGEDVSSYGKKSYLFVGRMVAERANFKYLYPYFAVAFLGFLIYFLISQFMNEPHQTITSKPNNKITPKTFEEHSNGKSTEKLAEELAEKKQIPDSSYTEMVFVKSINIYIDKKEVTNQEFCNFLNSVKDDHKHSYISIKSTKSISMIEKKDGTYLPQKGCSQKPVVNVTWYGAMEYAKFYGKRLPTSEEWYIAAIGGSTKNKKFIYAGSNNANEVAHFNKKEPSIVATKKPNELGLYDMSGNVWEWCADSLQKNYNCNRCIDGLNRRIVRGGSYVNNKDCLKLTQTTNNYCAEIVLNSIYSFCPSGTLGQVGFRCVKDAK